MITIDTMEGSKTFYTNDLVHLMNTKFLLSFKYTYIYVNCYNIFNIVNTLSFKSFIISNDIITLVYANNKK